MKADGPNQFPADDEEAGRLGLHSTPFRPSQQFFLLTGIQEQQHTLLKIARNGRNWFGDVPFVLEDHHRSQRRQVLDLGYVLSTKSFAQSLNVASRCGTGAWYDTFLRPGGRLLDQVFLGRIKEMAEEFSHCDFTGVDLAPMLERTYVTPRLSVSPTPPDPRLWPSRRPLPYNCR